MTPSLRSPTRTFALNPFQALHQEINRVFDDVFRVGLPAMAGGEGEGAFLLPQMDVRETADELRISAELPGVAEKDIEVVLEDNQLTIRAEKRNEWKEERENAHFVERRFGTFQRTLTLPFHAEPDQVKAKFENGVLMVTVPKTAQAEHTHKIPIQGPGSQPSSDQQTAGRHQGEAA